MRVLQLLKTGVGASWAVRQAKRLRELGVDVHVALPDGPMVAKLRAADCTPHVVDVGFPARAPLQIPAALRRLRAVVDTVGPDVLHSHFVSTTLTMRLALGRDHRIPRLFQVPGPLHLEHPVTRALEIGSAGPADDWCGSCLWTCARYRRSGIAAERVHYSVYGIDTDEVTMHPPGALRGELGIPAGRAIVGMVAYVYAPKRLLGQRRGLKGHEDLIDALAWLRGDGRDVVGVFVGGPWEGADRYEQAVHAYARARLGDAAIFLGTRSDVPALYADMDVVAHPSLSENMGGASESLLLGRPTVATRIGGLPDIVRDGDTGWLVPAQDPAALARALADALDHPAEAARRAAAGQALVRELVNVRRTAPEMIAIYERLVARAARRTGTGAGGGRT